MFIYNKFIRLNICCKFVMPKKNNLISKNMMLKSQEQLINEYYKSVYGPKKDIMKLQRKVKEEKLQNLKKLSKKNITRTKRLSKKVNKNN